MSRRKMVEIPKRLLPAYQKVKAGLERGFYAELAKAEQERKRWYDHAQELELTLWRIQTLAEQANKLDLAGDPDVITASTYFDIIETLCEKQERRV